MLDKFYYESNDKAYTLYFGDLGGMYINESDIRGYSWSYSKNNLYISNFHKEPVEKNIPVLFVGDSQKHLIDMRNHAFYVFERDVLIGKPGKIYINGYYLECFVIGASNRGYIYPKHIETTFTIVAEGPVWKKETTFQFLPTSREASDDGIDFNFDFNFDLGLSKDEKNNTIENDAIVESEFIMTIYGRCTDPDVEINGHHYRINGTIAENERVVITSSKPKNRRGIKKYNNDDGSIDDWFGHRWKEESVFQPIPSGVSPINYDGTFGFEITLIDERSEPPWEYTEERVPDESVDETPEEPVIDAKDYEYLLDMTGADILDSYGDNVEVEVI